MLDVCIEIPQLGIIRSLNVHVSGSILLWEYISFGERWESDLYRIHQSEESDQVRLLWNVFVESKGLCDHGVSGMV